MGKLAKRVDAEGKLRHTMGKVHGSLARAGKVRGQTPKVEKQEKKKVPKGRAYKRLLYNRRFVNVVVGFGKKRRRSFQRDAPTRDSCTTEDLSTSSLDSARREDQTPTPPKERARLGQSKTVS